MSLGLPPGLCGSSLPQPTPAVPPVQTPATSCSVKTVTVDVAGLSVTGAAVGAPVAIGAGVASGEYDGTVGLIVGTGMTALEYVGATVGGGVIGGYDGTIGLIVGTGMTVLEYVGTAVGGGVIGGISMLMLILKYMISSMTSSDSRTRLKIDSRLSNCEES